MEKKAVILHISRMLEALEEDPLRAVYMVTKQLYDHRRP